jgi:branched-chain amino acid transport system substrate-binding protein
MKSIHTLGVVVIWLAAVLIAGCTSVPSDQGTPGSGNASKETVIHALVDVSGADAVLGESAKAALVIAERDLNEHYQRIGSDHRVRIVINDTGTNPATALEQLKALDAAGVRLVLAQMSSAEVKAIKPYADQHGILLVATGSTAVELAVDDQVLRFCPNDRQQAAALAEYLLGQKITHLVPVWRGDVWGDGLVNETRTSLGAKGTVASGVRYDPATTDFGAAVSRLDVMVGEAIAGHGANTTAVHAITFGECAELMRAATDAPNLSLVRWYGSDGNALVPGITSDPTVAAFAGKVRFVAPIMGIVPNNRQAFASVETDLRSSINRTPDAGALALYDAAFVASLVADQGVGTGAEAVKESFVETAARYSGASGSCVLTREGDRSIPVYDFWGVTAGVAGSAEWERIGWSADWGNGVLRFRASTS